MEIFRKVAPYTINEITGRLPEDYHLAMLGLERGMNDERGRSFNFDMQIRSC
jgi:hypothetical protein